MNVITKQMEKRITRRFELELSPILLAYKVYVFWHFYLTTAITKKWGELSPLAM